MEPLGNLGPGSRDVTAGLTPKCPNTQYLCDVMKIKFAASLLSSKWLLGCTYIYNF